MRAGCWSTKKLCINIEGKRKQQILTPAESSRDATINVQGQLFTKGFCHQAPISNCHMYGCEPACVFAALFDTVHNPSLSQTHKVLQVKKNSWWRMMTEGREESALYFYCLKTQCSAQCAAIAMFRSQIYNFLYIYINLCYTNCSSPVPVGGIIVGSSLVEAPLCQGLLLVQNKLLETHLHLSAGHSTWRVKT